MTPEAPCKQRLHARPAKKVCILKSVCTVRLVCVPGKGGAGVGPANLTSLRKNPGFCWSWDVSSLRHIGFPDLLAIQNMLYRNSTKQSYLTNACFTSRPPRPKEKLVRPSLCCKPTLKYIYVSTYIYIYVHIYIHIYYNNRDTQTHAHLRAGRQTPNLKSWIYLQAVKDPTPENVRPPTPW